MKILRKDFTADWDDSTTAEEKQKQDVFTFALQQTTLSCSFTLDQCSPKSFEIDLAQHKGECINVNTENLEQPNTLTIFPGFTTYSYGNRLAGKSLSSSAQRIMRIYVNEDGTDCDVHLMTGYPVTVEGFENIVIDKELTYTGAMTTYSEYGAAILAKVKKKSALLGELDNGNSIAYLEAQVDVLTRYVLNKHMNDIDDEELREILVAANQHSILDIKSKDKLIEEMTHKAHTRQEQLKYYENN